MNGAPTRSFDGTTVITNPIGFKEAMGGIRLSFEDDEQGAIKIRIPYRAILTRIRSIVTKALASGNVGSVTFASPSGEIQELEHSASAALGDEESEVLDHTTGNNLFAAGSDLTITTAKTTEGGKVAVDLDLLRIGGP